MKNNFFINGLLIFLSFNANAFFGDPLDDARDSYTVRQELCLIRADEVKSVINKVAIDIINDVGYFDFEINKISNNGVRALNVKEDIEGVACQIHFQFNDKNSGQINVTSNLMQYYVDEDGDFLRQPKILEMTKSSIIRELKDATCKSGKSTAYEESIAELKRLHTKNKDNDDVQNQIQRVAELLWEGVSRNEAIYYVDEDMCKVITGSNKVSLRYTVTPTVIGIYNVDTDLKKFHSNFPSWYVTRKEEKKEAQEEWADFPTGDYDEKGIVAGWCDNNEFRKLANDVLIEMLVEHYKDDYLKKGINNIIEPLIINRRLQYGWNEGYHYCSLGQYSENDRIQLPIVSIKHANGYVKPVIRIDYLIEQIDSLL